ncbi:hypothetical protein LFL96_33845 [Paraburkholderia sp. D15]|uniref:hypothetical protein n=1 Tax=Paraburkholderia sp. D15 TaxID=2880218 RepID=UPI00247A62BD|nr:hypothetical protein [Paraburkholderia sp. D15]WGS53151.1 hypothetical protein LFL96_33845 [Paraburkholderia sp. D15]
MDDAEADADGAGGTGGTGAHAVSAAAPHATIHSVSLTRAVARFNGYLDMVSSGGDELGTTARSSAGATHPGGIDRDGLQFFNTKRRKAWPGATALSGADTVRFRAIRGACRFARRSRHALTPMEFTA